MKQPARFRYFTLYSNETAVGECTTDHRIGYNTES